MIIVTGANGFIASTFIWELNRKGITDIIAVDSVGLEVRNLLQKRQYTEFLLHDQLWNYLKTSEAIQDVEWVVHMGACSSTTETNWEFLKENNFLYTQRLFDWCTAHKKNLIYASSAATYGDGAQGFSDETDSEILKPLNLYGESKVQFDRWAVKQKNTPPHWYGLKFFNVFGPSEAHKNEMSSLVYKAFHQIKKNGNLKLFRSHRPDFKDGEQVRDFVYVKDVTRWMCELMETHPANGIYNMGFGVPRSWLDLAKSVFQAIQQPMKIEWMDIPENIRNQYQYFTEADMSKWHKAKLSPPQWPLEKAVEDYVKNSLMKIDPEL